MDDSNTQIWRSFCCCYCFDPADRSPYVGKLVSPVGDRSKFAVGTPLINYGNIKLKISANVYQPRFESVVKDAVPPEK